MTVKRVLKTHQRRCTNTSGDYLLKEKLNKHIRVFLEGMVFWRLVGCEIGWGLSFDTNLNRTVNSQAGSKFLVPGLSFCCKVTHRAF